MTDIRTGRSAAGRPGGRAGTSLALASRGDALAPYLFDALERRFRVVGRIDAELTPLQRYRVAAATFRPNRSRWVERFYKSATGTRLRTANATRAFGALPERPDAVLQVHALFEVPSAAGVLYVDCTHRQSAALWPDWNPLQGDALAGWYRHEQRSYESARHLFAFSGPTRNSIVQDYGIPEDRVTVVGAGVNFDALPEVALAPERQSTEPARILFIGNDFVRKGGPVLLDAFRQVRAAMPDTRLTLVGTPPRIAPQPGVEVLGRIRDRERIAALYAGASVFAMPSHFDPFPLVALESMAFGVPVVTTRQSGTPEMITDGVTGELVRAGRVDELAEALLRVLWQPRRATAMARAARARVEQRFTWDAVVDRMAPALEALGAER